MNAYTAIAGRKSYNDRTMGSRSVQCRAAPTRHRDRYGGPQIDDGISDNSLNSLIAADRLFITDAGAAAASYNRSIMLNSYQVTASVVRGDGN